MGNPPTNPKPHGWHTFLIQGSRGGDPFWVRGQPTIGWIGELDGTRYGNYLGPEYCDGLLSWHGFWNRIQMLIEQGALTYAALRNTKGPESPKTRGPSLPT